MSMNTATSNGHAKSYTKAYRTIVTPPVAPTGSTRVPTTTVTTEPGLFDRIGSWLGGIVTKVVNAAKKVGRWIRGGTVKVAVDGKKAGRLARTGFVKTAAPAGKVGRGIRTAFVKTMRVCAVGIGRIIRVVIALIAGLVAIPVAFYTVVKMVITSDPRFGESIIPT